MPITGEQVKVEYRSRSSFYTVPVSLDSYVGKRIGERYVNG